MPRRAGVSRAALYRSYPHLKEEFERRLAAVHASGTAAPDPRDAQITRLKTQNGKFRQKLADRDSAVRDLEQFKVTAPSRLAAQHDKISRGLPWLPDWECAPTPRAHPGTRRVLPAGGRGGDHQGRRPDHRRELPGPAC